MENNNLVISAMDDSTKYSIDYNTVLGYGSFSKVYLGKLSDQGIDVDIAIKRINLKNLNGNTKVIVEEEVRIMNFIKCNSNPNIVECYDVIQKNNIICFFMEFMENDTLRTIMIKPIKEQYVKFYFVQLSNGLQYLYKNNIIHRDIKPRNILLTNNKRTLKIADFGLAKKRETKFGSDSDEGLYKTICGSPLYMAPEIVKQNKYNKQSDLWSLGIIMFEMLYGYHPFGNCKSMDELSGLIEKSIKIPPNNTKIKLGDLGTELIKILLESNNKNRITWNDFFIHEWLKPLENDIKINIKININKSNMLERVEDIPIVKNDLNDNVSEEESELEESNNNIIDSNSIVNGPDEIYIIDNYIDFDLSDSRDKSSNQFNTNSDCMFDMDIEGISSTNINIKPDDESKSSSYEIVHINNL